ncbi:MAG: hypothetical protein AB7S38_34240 [Vulcanimicrobiota bacterium]
MAKIDRKSESTPLIRAIENGTLEDVRFWLEQGADPNFPDRNGRTPLEAVFQADKDPDLKMQLSELLLRRGARPVGAVATEHLGFLASKPAMPWQKVGIAAATLALVLGAWQLRPATPTSTALPIPQREVIRESPSPQPFDPADVQQVKEFLDQGEPMLALDNLGPLLQGENPPRQVLRLMSQCMLDLRRQRLHDDEPSDAKIASSDSSWTPPRVPSKNPELTLPSPTYPTHKSLPLRPPAPDFQPPGPPPGPPGPPPVAWQPEGGPHRPRPRMGQFPPPPPRERPGQSTHTRRFPRSGDEGWPGPPPGGPGQERPPLPPGGGPPNGAPPPPPEF